MTTIDIKCRVHNEFITAMVNMGIEAHQPLNVEANGQLERFRIKGDKTGSKNGWYVLFGGAFAAGSFGSWKTGLTSTWRAKTANKISKKELTTFKQQRQKSIERLEQHRIKVQHDAAVDCGKIWSKASQLIDVNHPYLLDKKIRAYGIRQLGERLLVPIMNAQNELVSIQFIGPTGQKSFKSGGRVKGCFMVIGELKNTVFICEGYATGSTIHEATKLGVIIAFNASNLSPVISSLKANGLNQLNIIIAADNDFKNTKNIGLEKGQESAYLNSLLLIYPYFSKNQDGSDFNDLARMNGLSKVAKYLRNVAKDISK
ncbi:toprim domain-containing protein [Psychromonas sp. SR45-3]|uniref:toprim domain-containing protein n=1 Tax=Psychromonas sp. SR45-3 TaxID=2760930 RepID=UPI0015FC4DEC|nr:toprim domain-containing protein [Psychromonas sp. SR45-3]MBB1272508.1 toprim domain-containing protein [Psychromonas sp. SR45-3]